MASKPGEWWQKVKRRWMTIGVVGIGLVVVIALIIFGYRLDWTGFNGNNKSGKTLWDWLQLLIIPIMLVIGGFWLNQIQKSREEKATELRTKIEREATEKHAQTEREISLDNQREVALQDYIDKMSELLLKGHLSELKPEYEEIRRIARVRTLTLLPRLDGKRKGSLLQFLHESSLIGKGKRIVDLTGADLSNIDLANATWREVHLGREGILHWAILLNLRGNMNNADLSAANLRKADFSGIDLIGADIQDATLHEANLSGTNLQKANLQGTNLTKACLFAADLSGANLRDASLVSADLNNADLCGADLRDAHLNNARLCDAGLQEADLRGTDLGDLEILNLDEADLERADLSRSDLKGARITPEQWNKATSLEGATMPDGSIHP